MPYIPREQRFGDDGLAGTEDQTPTAGVLAYVLADVVDEFVGMAGLNYDVICAVRSGLKGVLGEFERKIAEPYEDAKCAENGEVFDRSLARLHDVVWGPTTDAQS